MGSIGKNCIVSLAHDGNLRSGIVLNCLLFCSLQKWAKEESASGKICSQCYIQCVKKQIVVGKLEVFRE